MKNFGISFFGVILVLLSFFATAAGGGGISVYAEPLDLAANAKKSAYRQVSAPRKQDSARNAEFYGDGFTFSLHQGFAVAASKMNEYVYYKGRTVSHLIWETDPYTLINLGATLRKNRLRFDFDGFWKLNENGGKMDDYDWFVPGDWTHHSWHDDVPITSAYSYDLNVSYAFLQGNYVELKLIVGNKREHLKMEARGGKFIYSSFDNHGNLIGFRDKKGTFLSNVLGIAYEQTWNALYLGVGGEYDLNPNLKIKGRLIYAPLAYGDDIDDHAMRNMTTKDEVLSTMTGLDFGIKWQIRNNLIFNTDFTYEKYQDQKGNGTYYFGDNDTISYGIDNIGMGFETSKLAINLEYIF